MAGGRDLDRLQHEIQELLTDLWQVPRVAGLRQGFRPQVDCYRNEDPPAVTVVVDLAGVDPEEVRVLALEDTLVIEGERRRPKVTSRVSYQQMEIDYGPFQRRVPLPDGADVDRARASYERGLLQVVVPIAPRPKRPGRVSIRVRARS